MDFVNQIQEKILELHTTIKLLAESGTKKSEAEYNYKIKLTQECQKLRDKGTAVTLIDKLVYGIPEVAKLRADRDVKETMCQVYQEKINAIKLEIRMLDNQLSREWGATK